MNGTLAIWYEPAAQTDPGSFAAEEQTQAEKPNLELHFNLWRDMPSGTNFLDIGLKISRAELLTRIYIYFPVVVRKNQLSDLSEVMKFGQTLNAVFNSVVAVEKQSDVHYTTLSNGMPFVAVHKISIENDIEIDTVEDGLKGPGSTITFTDKMCERLWTEKGVDQYIRFRVKLNGKTRHLFTQEVVAKDKIFVSSSHRLELTELRLNEHRSFPSSIAKNAQSNAFVISRVHYFLIRELGNTLVTQHAPLRKVRRLEANLWAAYLNGAPTVSHDAAEEERLASRMVIYHWREGSPKDPIADFTAFASFQTSAPGLAFYIIALVLLGAVGSSVSAWGLESYGLQTSLIGFLGGIALLWLITWSGLWAWLGARFGDVKRSVIRRLRKLRRAVTDL
ncbi:hypothetical protein [Sinorhizobium saheli]|uniref:Uncharacterized protein n=1 Tax=Sinorhizobium saheli TaxID=36856 RepID=A0A178YTJ7_SINSA|nr:hypothetical protein [Sinorhizobium saheli]MQW90693.1 hypothetical protein [Sinorhizobium saheli]OAP50075.1 hypothetical protein ATB98_12275 [Sinorhizobium saheli]